MTTQPTSAVTDAEIDAALRITVDAYGCFTTPEVAAMRQALAEFAQSRASDATIAQPVAEGDAKDAPYLEDLILERNTAQEGLDNAMKALQNYSRIKGVRQSDIAKASYAPALWKKRLDAAIAAIASQKATPQGNL